MRSPSLYGLEFSDRRFEVQGLAHQLRKTSSIRLNVVNQQDIRRQGIKLGKNEIDYQNFACPFGVQSLRGNSSNALGIRLIKEQCVVLIRMYLEKVSFKKSRFGKCKGKSKCVFGREEMFMPGNQGAYIQKVLFCLAEWKFQVPYLLSP